ncbi:hypothetical protein HK405_005071 [Cladochytrium tenue]|nr:hypothetical protein HK405_005071 [Cladochytrium tenue]
MFRTALLVVATVAAAATPVAALDNGLGLNPIMGWSTRHVFGCKVSENVLIDDCWMNSSRDPVTGEIQPNATRFPSGIPALAEYVHERGLRLGLSAAIGGTTCDPAGAGPSSWRSEYLDAETFADWGIDHLKYETCIDQVTSSWHATAERYGTMQQALNETGRPIYFAMANYGLSKSWEFAGVLANSYRTTFNGCDKLTGWWCSVMGVLDLSVDAARFAAPGGFSDLDILHVGNGGMSDSEYMLQFSAWAALKSPLILSADIRSLTDSDREIITNPDVLEINQDPLGASALYVAYILDSRIDVLVGPLANGDRVMLLVNRHDKRSTNVPISAGYFGGRSGFAVGVKDLWRTSENGEKLVKREENGGFVVDYVDPLSVRMFRISPVERPFDTLVPRPSGTYTSFTFWLPLHSFIRWYRDLDALTVVFVNGLIAALPVLTIALMALRSALAIPVNPPKKQAALKEKKDK